MVHKDIVGYSNELSARPGDTLEFKVSAYGPDTYHADIVRIRCGDALPGGVGVKESLVDSSVSGDYAARFQSIPIGSYAMVPASPMFNGFGSFTLQAMIWPTLPGGGEQAIVGTWCESLRSGFCLLLDDEVAV